MTTPKTDSGSPPADRIAAINSSLRCFVYSLLGLIPILGIPFAVAAMCVVRQARRARPDWNPADRYLRAARRIAPLGFLSTAAFVTVVGLFALGLWDDLLNCGSGSS